jgi:hypothetical protein
LAFLPSRSKFCIEHHYFSRSVGHRNILNSFAVIIQDIFLALTLALAQDILFGSGSRYLFWLWLWLKVGKQTQTETKKDEALA